MTLRCIIRDRAHPAAELVFHSVFEKRGRYWVKLRKAEAEDMEQLPLLCRDSVSDTWPVNESEYRMAVLFQHEDRKAQSNAC